MQEINLIEGEAGSEPRVNNAPVVVNEVDTNLLNIATEDELSNQLGCDCRMNKDISLGVKETSYKCSNCPDNMKHLCLYCLEICHKSHINNLPSDLFKGDLIDFQKTPCECALANHKTSIKNDNLIQDNRNQMNCPFNKLFALIKPKYVYRRKENNKIYCLYCINNYTIPYSIDDDMSSSLKGSKLSAFGSIIRKSIQDIENEERKNNAEKENVSDDINFYAKYDKVEVDYSKPFPQCECVDDLHKHQIISENIDNLCIYMTNIVDRNKINLDKLSYQIFNNDLFCEVLFNKLIQTHETIYNSIKDIAEIDPAVMGNLSDESNFTEIELDDKADWEVYHKSVKLMELAAKRMKIFNFFGLKWISENIKNYFSFETLSKLLQCKSNIESNFFKLQLFTTRIYRQSTFMNIPHILLNNENMSFINRQLFCSTGSSKTEQLFIQGNKIVEKIFYLLDFLSDNPLIDSKDYNLLFIEALKILKTIIPYKANDINSVMNLFRRIENNISNIKEKKENLNKVIHSLEKIIEKIFSYFNDNKFVFGVKEAEIEVKYDFSFLASSEYNKELLSTLYNFDEMEINDVNPFINSENFYDGLLSENDSYSEIIENILNSDEKWLRKVNKEYNYVFHGAEQILEVQEVKDFFNTIVSNIQEVMNNQMTDFQFLYINNQLLENLISFYEKQEKTFKVQARFFQNKYFIKLLFLICLEERISRFEANTEIENTEERKKIDDLRRRTFDNFGKLLILVTQDNPMAGSLLFSRIAITLLIRDKFEDLNLYIEILKMMKKYNCKINTYFLTSHIHIQFQEKMIINEENIKNIITLLNIYKLILKISSDKSILKVNNIISSDLKFIIDSQDFKYSVDYLANEAEIDLVEGVYKCMHLLQNEYFYIINQFIDIKKIIERLRDDNLSPRIRKIFTQIHTDYFIRKYFSTITIQKFFQNENLITSNLVENLANTPQQKELQEYLSVSDKKSQVSDTGEEKMSNIMHTIFNNLECYRLFHNKNSQTFEQNFKFTVSFFKNLVLYPTIYSVYKLTYFPKNYTGSQKYDLFKLMFLYLQCCQFFYEDIISKYNLEDPENAKVWSRLLIESANIDEIKENINKGIEALGFKNEKILNIKFLITLFIDNSKYYKIVDENFLEKEESEEKVEEEEVKEEDEEYALSFYNLGLYMNLFNKIKKELQKYKEKKKIFEGNNVFDDIFQDENLEVVQKTICMDLLNKLYYKKVKSTFFKQEHVGYSFQSDLIKGPDSQVLQKRKSLFTGIYKGRRGARTTFNPNFNDKTDKYGDFYNPYLSPYLEEKSMYFEIIDKCFKVNPSMWQEIFVDIGTYGRDLIYNIIMKQLPFLLQFIFIEFNKIDKKDTKYYDYFVNVLEFLRLLCEDHNPLFQTMFINYEKAIGKVSILSNDNNLFIPFLSKIPIFVLLNVKYNNSKTSILRGFVPKRVEYFYPLIEKITDFLIEIIQGTYPENFNDLTTSIDEVSCFGIVDNIKKHYQFLDYLDTDLSYESFINYFFKFFNCFVEEGANPLSIKVPIMNIFHPKKLLNISINSFKNCIYKYVGKTIKEGCSDELIQIFIKDYDTIMEDTSFSLFLTLFLYIKRANSFKEKLLGDKYQQILDTLKELEESDEVFEENSIFLLRKEYYKFCTALTRETEISFFEDKSKEDRELFKYRDFFSSTYMKEVIEFRNKNCAKIQNFENVFFLVHPDSLYIKPSDTDLFLQKASYDNFNTKLTCILDYYSELNQLIEMRKTLSKNMLALSQINYINMELINAGWAMLTNILFAFGKAQGTSYIIMMGSALTHIAFLVLLILNWYVFEFIKKSKTKDFKFTFINFFKLLFFSLFNPEVFPFIWTLCFGILGCLGRKWHFLFSLQLFPIFTLFDMMRNVLDAVKARYNQFLSTGFLIIILILFSSAITFYFFNYDSEGNQLCSSYLNCFIYLFNYGIRGGGLPFNIKILEQEGFWGEFIFNWIFYFILILVILNIASGIIVDKFQDLREKNDELYEEKENVCFICSLHRSNFEIKGIDFEYHQQHEHNIGNYFHYLMKINRTDEHDLNSIDFQVYNAFQQKKIEFFPIKKAKSLENK